VGERQMKAPARRRRVRSASKAASDKKTKDWTGRRTVIRRFFYISDRIQSGRYPSPAQLVDELEVSRATIFRDIEFMRDELELPIVCDRAKGGYFYDRPNKKSLLAPITREDIQNLVLGQRCLGQYTGLHYREVVRETVEKLKQHVKGLDGGSPFTGALSFFAMAPENVDMRKMDILGSALEESRGIRFLYRERGSLVEEQFSGYPYEVAIMYECVYLYAYIPKAREVQSFPLSRMRKIARTREKFIRPADFDLEKHLQGGFLVDIGNEDHELVVELNVAGSDSVRPRRLPGGGKFTALPKGRGRVHMRLNTLVEVEQWIRHLGEDVKVIKPEALAKRLKGTARAVDNMYPDFPED
jgi:predicted DNA-binding transcriptional regulator YafY